MHTSPLRIFACYVCARLVVQHGTLLDIWRQCWWLGTWRRSSECGCQDVAWRIITEDLAFDLWVKGTCEGTCFFHTNRRLVTGHWAIELKPSSLQHTSCCCATERFAGCQQFSCTPLGLVLYSWVEKPLKLSNYPLLVAAEIIFFCDTVSVLAIISNCRLSDNVDGQIVATCMIHKQLLSKPLRFWMSPVSLLVTSTLLVMALAISRLSILTPLFDCGLWEGEAKGHDERCLALHDRLTMIFTTGLAFYAGEGRWTFPRFTLWLLCSTHRPTVSRSGCHALTGTDFSTLSETNAVIFHQMCWWWKRTCYIVIQKKKLNRTKIQWLSRSAGLCLWQTEHFDTFWYILFSKFEGFEFWTKCCDICSVWRFWMSFDSSRWGFGASLSAPHGPTEQEVISTAGETQVVFLGIFANKNKQKKR